MAEIDELDNEQARDEIVKDIPPSVRNLLLRYG
jgi:hypothetical protein